MVNAKCAQALVKHTSKEDIIIPNILWFNLNGDKISSVYKILVESWLMNLKTSLLCHVQVVTL